MIGRLDAPGAKLEPVMPGLENSRSPSVLAGAAQFLVRHDRHGRELVGDDGQRALCGVGAAASCTGGAGPRVVADAARETRVGTCTAGFRFTIGLGADTLTSGSAGASWASAVAAQRQPACAGGKRLVFVRILIVPFPDAGANATDRFRYVPGRAPQAGGASSATAINRQETGGARDWNGDCAESR